MKFKQVAGIVFISAATTLGSLWGYNHFNPSGTTLRILCAGFRQSSFELRKVF